MLRLRLRVRERPALPDTREKRFRRGWRTEFPAIERVLESPRFIVQRLSKFLHARIETGNPLMPAEEAHTVVVGIRVTDVAVLDMSDPVISNPADVQIVTQLGCGVKSRKVGILQLRNNYLRIEWMPIRTVAAPPTAPGIFQHIS